MNKWVGIGRLVANPEVAMTQGGTKVARYRIAVNRAKKQDGTQEADFINCVCFNKSADFVEKFLNKGTKIAVVGRIQTGSYEKDGQRIYTTDIIVEEHEFCESKGSGNGQQTQASPTIAYTAPAVQQPQQQSFEPQKQAKYSTALDDFSSIASDDGDLPF